MASGAHIIFEKDDRIDALGRQDGNALEHPNDEVHEEYWSQGKRKETACKEHGYRRLPLSRENPVETGIHQMKWKHNKLGEKRKPLTCYWLRSPI
jgi:hypothetical protein